MALSEVPASIRYTYDFVSANLPVAAQRVLEIGCGAGEVAALLMGDGLDLVAIDLDAEQVANARAAGVEAMVMSWPAQVDQEFDAVLFTRSLHHIHDLAGSIDAARAVLRLNGRIIVEDFRAGGGSERSALWFSGLVKSLEASGALIDDTSLEELLDKVGPSSTHEHPLHSSAAIASELCRLNTVVETDAAYYFRYIEPHLRRPDRADGLLALELEMIKRGVIDALGKRFVAQDR